ncbi:MULTISPECIES: Mu transposase C-terminal domain-containing protein [Cyanophyceae]|uniref:Mu transposase C-terminal domain-containing protein n=1 Tax=Cyanophyceae TaxID=3028117 RepID=UPI001681C3B0|nr:MULTISPECIES: Mu transposase C-terminal domain-containing protein [Cyanophyceae]MBD1916279.1 DDE-type integrase/transposase/recombinase [Phormidium sp. FACHB-77]MBD2028405.1 DDE-type integrase/transposase/recombinase [Phormidium sp. FACHB-322]MBD2051884.1 DDE-type integrase/transposase/recombinase [Leptolyngbya sp. FACHB-60]
MDTLSEETPNLDEQVVFPVELSPTAQKRLDAIMRLLEPCASRKEYGDRLRTEAAELGVSERTLHRYKRQWYEKGLIGLADDTRADKGKSRIHPELQNCATKLFKNRNRNGKRLNRKDVYKHVRQKAIDLGLKPPAQSTIYDLLKPLYEAEENKKSIRTPGWQGETLILSIKDGGELKPEASNQVWQIDHTPADILLVDQEGNLLGCPWLTTVVDSYSRCIVGFHLGFDAPSSKVVTLALRQAILPKRYSASYDLKAEWGTYGLPKHIYTDNGKDFRSDHAQQVAGQLGFTWHYRSRPSEGGIVERFFRTLNDQVWSKLEGYKGSNVQERPKGAEQYAVFTLEEVQKGLVRYIIHQYNQSIDDRTRQNRYQRWEAGLLHSPTLPSERELDVCLLKQATRKVQRGGHISFEDIVYKGEYLAGYAGQKMALRYDPDNLGVIYIYRIEHNKEEFLARGFPLLEGFERRSLKEWQAIKKAMKLSNTVVTSTNISEFFEKQDDKPKKTLRQRRKVA